MGDERKVSEMSLDVGVQDDIRPSIAQRASVLIQQIHQFLGHLPATTPQYSLAQTPIFQTHFMGGQNSHMNI